MHMCFITPLYYTPSHVKRGAHGRGHVLLMPVVGSPGPPEPQRLELTTLLDKVNTGFALGGIWPGGAKSGTVGLRRPRGFQMVILPIQS